MKDSLYWFKPAKRDKLLSLTADSPVIESVPKKEPKEGLRCFSYENGILTIPVYRSYHVQVIRFENNEIYVKWVELANGEWADTIFFPHSWSSAPANHVIQEFFEPKDYQRDIVLDLNGLYAIRRPSFFVEPTRSVVTELDFKDIDQNNYNEEGLYTCLAKNHIYRTKEAAIQALPKDIIIKVPVIPWDSLAYEAEGYSVVEMEYVSKDNHLLIRMHKQ